MPRGHVQQGEGDRDVARRRGPPCLTTGYRRCPATATAGPRRRARRGCPTLEERRGTAKPVLASSSGSEIWKTRNSSRGQIVGQPTQRARPAVFLSAEGMCAGLQQRMESPAQRCSPLRDEAVLLQPGQLLAGGRRASRGRWQACSSRRRCGRPDVQVRGGGVVAAAEAVPTVTQPEHNITGRRRRLCHTVGDRSIAPAGPAAIEVARHF
jgi:hypothetical protein